VPELVESLAFHGLPAMRIRSRDGACAIVTLQGAHLVSWEPAGAGEALYVSERSPFEAGRAIRGGVPVVFPQFADRGSLAQHGFARNLAWTFMGVEEIGNDARASFVLESSAETMALWPHAFRLQLEVAVGGSRLQVELRMANTGTQPFSCATALHTYLRVSDAAKVGLTGLRGARYMNRGSNAVGVEERDIITAAEPIDRVYFATPSATSLDDSGRALRIEQRGFTDTVVWNPGRERTAQMTDMPPEGFRHMLCVEAASIDPLIEVDPGAKWSGVQAIVIYSG
jgi:glucose-6-phosphate 1-epimerase